MQKKLMELEKHISHHNSNNSSMTHQWTLKLMVQVRWGRRYYTVLKYLPTNYLLTTKGKNNNFILRKPSRFTLTKWSKLVLIMEQVSITCLLILRRHITYIYFCQKCATWIWTKETPNIPKWRTFNKINDVYSYKVSMSRKTKKGWKTIPDEERLKSLGN